jgi:hypothetical protein
LIIIITILGFGTLVGIVMIRDALIKHYFAKQSSEAVVADATGRILGEAVDYDEHDAPRIFLVDRSLESPYRTLIGVRDDRFSSREAVYYSGANCTGTPCIKTISDESTSSRGIDSLSGTGNVSYFNALQGGPNYAVGRGDDGLPGYLFRETGLSCPVAPNDIQSRWMSQKVVAGEPCEAVDLDTETRTEPYTECLVDSPIEQCDCPSSTEDQGDLLSIYAGPIDTLLDTTILTLNTVLLITGQQIPATDIGTICCPIGSTLEEDEIVNGVVFLALNQVINDLDLSAFPAVQQQINTILAPLTSEVFCSNPVLLNLAESVPDPNEPEVNVFENYSAPFWVNLPSSASDEWYSVPPTEGEGW